MSEIAYDADGNLEARQLTVREYAEQHGLSTKTVKRALSAGQIPEAQMVYNPARGTEEWRIPEHATRRMDASPVARTQPQDHSAAPSRALEPVRAPGGQVVAFEPGERLLEVETNLREDLDDEPAFLTIQDAAKFLGIPQAQILANAERFGLEPVGVSGSMRVPQRVIRRIMGY